MKAIIKPTAAPGLILTDVDTPQYGANEVLIKPIKTSICGTDIHIDSWDAWAQKTIRPPLTIGHEFVGEVVAIGNNVLDCRVGDIVVGEGHVVCGHCRNCLEGKRHLCTHTQGIGVQRNGAFAELVVLPGVNTWRIDHEIPLDVYACFDPLGNAVHTALAYDIAGEDILITGAGPIGCMCAAVCKHVGARHVVVTDINPERLKLAKQMGADAAILADDKTIEKTMKDFEITEGFAVGLEVSGSIKALTEQIKYAEHGGNIALLGIIPGKEAIEWSDIIFKSLNLKGIYGRKMYDTWFKATAMLKSGLDISPVITHRFHYTEFQKAFELMHSGKCGKIILDW